MDIWMVAVAAGAGCIARHFKKFRNPEGRITSESSLEDRHTVKPDSRKQSPDKKQPFCRSETREITRRGDSEGVSSAEVASTSELDGQKGVILGNHEGSTVFSISSLLPGFIGNDDVEGVRVSDLVNGRLVPRNRSVLRSKRAMGRAVRPLSSLESSLMAQLYAEHVEMTEYTSGLYVSSPMQTVRPFLVTNGSEVISRARVQKSFLDENDTIFGVPPLPNRESLEISGKDKDNNGRGRTRRSSNSSTLAIREHFDFRRGSPDAMLLLCLGMSFGIISSFVTNRREVEKLNRLLKQTEGLVQDLQEELEMKDSLVMQELTIEDHKSQQTNTRGSPRSVSEDRNNEELVIGEEKTESFSRIEAELEAELEMLELNMTSSTLERRISNLVELDSGFEPDVAHGELRAEMLDDCDRTTTDRDRSGSSTTHSANYAVSPRELSLRLHEVLESQLEERIKELEAEIENKEKQNRKPWKDFSGDENPVVLNLSDETLDAYNEACNEFAKIDDESEEEDEMEKMLIKHIVEKARQGSPVVLNAQRAFFSE